MIELLGLTIKDSYFAIMMVLLVIMIVAAVRFYLFKPETMRAKCTKCRAIFDVPQGLAGFGMGPFKRVKCPACGKVSLMYTQVKMDVTWPPKEQPQESLSLSGEGSL